MIAIMQMRSSPSMLVLMVVLVMLLVAVPLPAQENIYLPPAPMPALPPLSVLPPGTPITTLPPAPPCAGCYQGFRFDTAFYFGAHFNGNWPGAMRIARDTFHIDIIQFYLGSTSLNGYFDSTQWHPTWEGRARWVDSLRRNFYRDIDSSGMKFIYGPGYIPHIAKQAEGAEVYFGQAGGDTIPNQYNFTSVASTNDTDRPARSFVWGGTFPLSTTPALPLRIAYGSRYSVQGLTIPGVDPVIGTDIRTKLYEKINARSDSGAYDVTVTMKADGIPLLMSDTTVLAFVKIYRRVGLGQDACNCNIYARIDSLAVTKGRYADSAMIDSNGYRNITFTLRFPSSTVTPSTTLKIDTDTALVAGVTVPRYRPSNGFAGWGTPAAEGSPGCARYCQRLADSLVSRGYISSDTAISKDAINFSDIYHDIYTTRKVDVTFLSITTAPRILTHIRKERFDSLIQAEIDATLSDPLINARLARVGVTDEQAPEKYRGHQEVAARVARHLVDRDPGDTRGIWANPQANASALRIFSGDLNITDVRIMHMMVNQIYNIKGPVPVAYANPDQMKYSPALNGYYRAVDPTPKPDADHWIDDRLIAYNTDADYKAYNENAVGALGSKLGQMIDMVNVARFKFRHIRLEPYPVSSVIQLHGFLEKNDTAYTGKWNPFRPTTPEEITAQSWLVLNAGMDALWFSDFTYDDAGEFGVVHWLTGDHSSNYQDGLNSGDPYKQTANWQLPKMWTGFKDRYNAVQRITSEFHDNILPVYTKLDRNGVVMPLYLGHSFSGMPMLDTLYTRRAAQGKVFGAYRDSMTIAFGDTIYYNDPADSTYMVATIFSPGPYDTNTTSRYLLLTSLRCWPVDSQTYTSYVDSLHPGTRLYGFGAIDVRKPVVVLKNSTGVIADSVRIQRIGDTTSRVFSFGDEIELNWLDPGWGAMYKITPIVKPISALGTAYNNAVHSLNPSEDNAAKDRLFVYERDSVVYLRALDSNGRWGPERMVSLASDMATIIIDGKKRNTADNMFPAIDMIRNGGSSCAIVWERRDNQTDSVTVEMAWLPSRPTTKAFPSGGIVRRTLSTPRELSQSWMQLTPAITGVDSGYVVAWASPDYTTEVIAVRDNPIHGRYDTSRVLRVKMIRTNGIMPNPMQPDSATATPSLAYVRNWGPTVMNGGILTGPDDETDFITIPAQAEGVRDTIKLFHITHLAYSQGKRSSPQAFAIMYNRIGVTFPSLSDSLIPRLWASPTEDASINISGCDRLYPSIAVDSARVGVTFTVQKGRDYVYLRFKDAGSTGKFSWNTTTYVWGGGTGPNARDYNRSSVTMFPDRFSTPLQSAFEGGLSWQWTNPARDRHNGVKFYRFGQFIADSVQDGQHPTMMLVPRIGNDATSAMRASGVFRRGPDATQFEQRRQRGDTGVYYPGYFDNTPVAPIVAFSTPPPTTIIHAEGQLRKPLLVVSGCETVKGGIKAGIMLRPNIVPPPDSIPSPQPPNGSLGSLGMPSSFFPRSSGLNDAMTSPSDLGRITRTPSFEVDTTTIKILRRVSGDDSLMTWLNGEPNDPISGLPANIYYSVQVVRDSDGVVLWTGDTISARGVAADTVLEEITVPVQSVASAGTKVHIKLVAVTSTSLECDIAGGFHLGDEGSGLPAKRIISRNMGATAKTGEAIGVRMIPNPLHTSSGELRITVPIAGSAQISIYDLLGNKVLTLPAIEIKRAGEYAIPVDLSALREGVYVVDVRSGSGRGSARITLVR